VQNSIHATNTVAHILFIQNTIHQVAIASNLIRPSGNQRLKPSLKLSAHVRGSQFQKEQDTHYFRPIL
jgi:hypothetical protein